MSTNTRSFEVWAFKIGFTIAVLIIVCALLAIFTGRARADECFKSDADVRTAYGEGIWSAYTHHMDGHKGTLCYYPSVKGSPRVHLNLERRRLNTLHAEIIPTPKACPDGNATSNAQAQTAVISARIFFRVIPQFRDTVTPVNGTFTVNFIPTKRFWTPWAEDGWKDEAFVMNERGVEWPLL